MTTIANRSKTALVVIDVQNGVVENAFNRNAVVANIGKAVNAARDAGVPVIWVQDLSVKEESGEEAWQIVSELAVEPQDLSVHKNYRSSFEKTNLEELLAEHEVSHLVVCGAESNNCLRHTAHSALDRGYDVTLISDAHTSNGYEWDGHEISAEQVVHEQNDNFTGYELPGRKADIVKAAELVFTREGK
jgi:nicotinamidase-related amidase